MMMTMRATPEEMPAMIGTDQYIFSTMYLNDILFKYVKPETDVDVAGG